MSKQSSLHTEHTGKKRAVFRSALLYGCVFIAAAIIGMVGVWTGVDRNVYDSLLRTRLESKPLEMSPRIIPVDLNDRAKRNLGESVESRESFVKLYNVLSQEGLIVGMDILFEGKKDAKADQDMAEAASKIKSLVSAVTPIDKEKSHFSGNPLDEKDAAILRKQLWHPIVKNAGNIPVAATFEMPDQRLAENTRFLGHIGVESDSDGVYRKTSLFFRWKDGYMPSFPLVLAAENLGIDTSHVVIDAGNEVHLPLRDGGIFRIPIDQYGAVWIPYPSDWESGWKRVPMDKLVNADENIGEAFFGGILVVADTTTGNKDIGITPFDNAYPLTGIHTSVLNGILTNTFFRPQPTALQVVIIFLLFAGSVWAVLRTRDSAFHLLFTGYFVLLCALTVFLWFKLNMVPSIALPAAALVLSWLIAFSIRLFRDHEQKILLKNALSRYFPRALAARVLAEKKTELKPTDKQLTILFSDIAGFTKWSSDKTPETVHAFLSDYLESMAAIIFEHGGTVDKFIGDGILAFFGDPFEQSDHAARAFRTALAMQRKVLALSEKWQPLVGIDLKIKIGINSGPVIVGNLGTRTRIEYTVIGTTVNLASRMKSNAPVGGILVTEFARAFAGTEFTYSERREIEAEGYEKPVAAFVLKEENIDSESAQYQNGDTTTRKP